MRCPQLDYYVGQSVQKVKYEDDPGAFAITLDSGAVITNEQEGSCPPGIEGFQIIQVDHDSDPSTIEVARVEGETVHSNQMVELSRSDYRIADDGYPEGPHYPGRVHEGMDEFETARPDDPSADRDKGMSDEQAAQTPPPVEES